MERPALPIGLPEPLDTELLSWAAGFFDGEGSTFARTEGDRPGYRRLQVTVPQAGDAPPEVLMRFRLAVLGLGRIDPPSTSGVFMWRARGRADAEIVIALLWPYLGEVKRLQASAAVEQVRDQYESGLYRKRKPRYSPTFEQHSAEPHVVSSPERLDRAWAAGFLDAEGCFGLARAGTRKRGPDWYRIRASASQHGLVGQPAQVLVKLRAVVRVGRIERHGEVDDFKWSAEGASSVEHVLDTVRPWLGSVKVSQAERALAAFAGQARLKSGGDRCLRGHTYDGALKMPNGRARKYCNACHRLSDRATRAAQGIEPRQFTNVPRRYTF